MEKRPIAVGGVERSAHIYVPASYAKSSHRSLVLALHGGGTHGESMARFSGLNDTARQAGFMVAYPNGSGRTRRILTWNSGACCGYARRQQVDDLRFLAALIDDLVRRHGVDPHRIYVTGMSNGAMMAYRLAAELPDRVAAVAAVGGALDVDPAMIRGPVPVVHFHGTADQHAPFHGGHGPKSAPGNIHRSVDETIQAWRKVNGAMNPPSEVEMPDKANDGTTVTRYVYASPTDPQSVVLYKIVGGGHTWPGQAKLERRLGPATLDISANEIMWEFFKSHVNGGR